MVFLQSLHSVFLAAFLILFLRGFFFLSYLYRPLYSLSAESFYRSFATQWNT